MGPDSVFGLNLDLIGINFTGALQCNVLQFCIGLHRFIANEDKSKSKITIGSKMGSCLLTLVAVVV